ncbi:MerR family transcriptional regulator [Teichococcus aestuarii]|uniref:Transcriptional regulator n=1 Tax=Teichococcus aestuarii TaxID=568898 RepID=A0A2U1UXP9_9PROT|nr:MerR family transcriptional regulator [Pseudoroseomonas aestuarii]PWC26449.1 transcriptional regulator [Pseudoroseomonas aestuarii]
MADRAKLWSVSALAREFGLTAQALRFYEARGLLHPRRQDGARVYDYRDHARLRLIQKFRRLGFSLEQIGEYLAQYRAGRPNAAQFRLGLARIEARLAELRQMRRELDETITELEAMHEDAQARLRCACHNAA